VASSLFYLTVNWFCFTFAAFTVRYDNFIMLKLLAYWWILQRCVRTI